MRFSYADQPLRLGREENALQRAWIALQLAGQISLLILLLTLQFSKRIERRRNPTVINFCIAWMLSTIPALLLFYSGHTAGSSEPSPSLCLLQATTFTPVPAMTATALFCVVMHVWIVTWLAREGSRRNLELVLLCAPYLVFFAFAIPTLLIGADDPLNVTRDQQVFYCSVRFHHLSDSVFGYSFLITLVSIFFEVWVATILYRNWRVWRHKSKNKGIDLAVVFRVVAFTFFQFVVACSSLISIWAPDVSMKLIEASSPLAVFLVFAIQPDVLRAWCFWRPYTPRSSPDPSPESSPSESTKTSVDQAYPDVIDIRSPSPVHRLGWVSFSKPLPALPVDPTYVGNII